MGKTLRFHKVRLIVNKAAFTLSEMLLVLGIVMCLILCTHLPAKHISFSKEWVFHQMQTIIESARLKAIESHESISLKFLHQGILFQDQCYLADDIEVITPKTITFNANGNISMGTTIEIKVKNESYQLIFNVGKGAYHLEKKSFYFTGYIICFCCLYFYRCSCLRFIGTPLQKLLSKRKSNDVYHCKVARKRAFTLIETLFALEIAMLIMLNFSFLIKGLIPQKELDFDDDLVSCIITLTEEVNTAKKVDVKSKMLVLETSEGTKEWQFNRQRLVSTPGFNIYLHRLDDVYFEIEEDKVYMTIERGNHSERFQIGTSFRPKKRLCQSACPSDSVNSDESCHAGLSEYSS